MPLNKNWGIVRSANPLWNVWANDQRMLDLYKKRLDPATEEMTCAGQLAELIITHCHQSETFLDAGCGAAYYYLSLLKRGFRAHYYGIDHTPEMIAIAQGHIGRLYLSEQHFRLMSIEDLNYEFDNVICFHVLTNSPHYMYLLERILLCTKKRVFLRENAGAIDHYEIDYRADPYLDADKTHLCVYHNKIPLRELEGFALKYGFKMREYLDERTKGAVEVVCDLPHTWKVIILERIEQRE